MQLEWFICVQIHRETNGTTTTTKTPKAATLYVEV